MYPGSGSVVKANEVERLPLSAVEVKYEWSYTSTPASPFVTCTGITLPTRRHIPEDSDFQVT